MYSSQEYFVGQLTVTNANEHKTSMNNIITATLLKSVRNKIRLHLPKNHLYVGI